MATKSKQTSLSRNEQTSNRTVFQCKPAKLSDLEKIQTLVKTSTDELFGKPCIKTFIKMKVCLSLFKNNDELVAFAVFSRRPNICIFSNFSWNLWIRKFYRLEGVTAWNSMFIHYMVWNENDKKHFLQYILKSLYRDNVYLKHVLLIVPPKLVLDDAIGLVFTKVLPIGVESPSNCQRIYLHYRHTAVPKLMIHKATEEENMDFIPLIQQNSSVLVDTYGSEFFGELIAKYSGLGRVFIAAEETKGICVGVMSLAPVNSYSLIQHHFDVCPYYGFCKPAATDLQSSFIHSTARGSTMDVSFPTACLVDVMDPVKVKMATSNLLGCHESNVEISKGSSEKTNFVFEEKGIEFEIIDEFVTRFVTDLTNTEPDFGLQPQIMSVFASYLIDLDKIDKDKTDFSLFSFVGRNKYKTKQRNKDISEDKQIDSNHEFPLGPGNAFLIEVFAMDPSCDSRSSHGLLEAAFECFPGRDYCLLTQPSRYSMFPLIDYFTRVVTNQRKSFPHELYFIHRNGVFANFKVRKAHISDFKTIESMVSHMINSKQILKELLIALSNEQKKRLVYVFLSEDSIIGFAMIKPYFDAFSLRIYYDFKEFEEFSHFEINDNGLIQHFLLSPIFIKFAPFFMREILRFSCLGGLFYQLNFPSSDLWSIDVSTISVLSEMIAVRPIHQIQYNISALGEYAPSIEDTEKELVALYYVNDKITIMKKTEINSKIVLVGGSDTAVAFLEYLIFRPSRKNFVYTNITLVASHGLPNEMNPHAARDAMLYISGKYKHSYMKKLGLHTWVNIVYGTMTDINRQEKTITIDGKDTIYYEYLFLFTGLQYPIPLQHNLRILFSSSNYCRKNLSSNLCHYLDNPPQNLFLINSEIDATNALHFVKESFDLKKPCQFVVYGSGLGPITCITSLLMFGVPAGRIEFVCQDLADKNNCFNNETVHHFVITCLLDLNVRINGPYEFHSWTEDSTNKLIRTVTFHHLHEEITFDCLAFFCFEEKITSSKTYNAISNSGIVYNGLIVIDRNFMTNDNYIYAAGPGTQYAKHYFAEDQMHKYFNSIEIGSTVAQYFCNKLEAKSQGLEFVEEGTPENKFLVRKMSVTICTMFTLPFQINCVLFRTCGKMQPNNGLNATKILETGLPLIPHKIKYFSLTLNSFGYVKEITCLTHQEIPDHNFFRLIGKHEQMLNNLVERYEKQYIYDFYNYFHEPWAYALYDDKFPQVLQKISAIYQKVAPVLDEIKKEYIIVEDTERQMYRILVMKELMNFINERSSYLPMYISYDYLISLQFLWNNSHLYEEKATSSTCKNVPSLSPSIMSKESKTTSLGSDEEATSSEGIEKQTESSNKVTIDSSTSENENIDSSEEEIATTKCNDSFLLELSKTVDEEKSQVHHVLSFEGLSQSESTSSVWSRDSELCRDIIENTDLDLLQSLKLIVKKLQVPKNTTCSQV